MVCPSAVVTLIFPESSFSWDSTIINPKHATAIALVPVSDITDIWGKFLNTGGVLLLFWIFISLIKPVGPVSRFNSSPNSEGSLLLIKTVSLSVYPVPGNSIRISFKY